MAAGLVQPPLGNAITLHHRSAAKSVGRSDNPTTAVGLRYNDAQTEYEPSLQP